MAYGSLLVLIGLTLAFVVADSTGGVDLTAMGWALVSVGLTQVADSTLRLSGQRRTRDEEAQPRDRERPCIPR